MSAALALVAILALFLARCANKGYMQMPEVSISDVDLPRKLKTQDEAITYWNQEEMPADTEADPIEVDVQRRNISTDSL